MRTLLMAVILVVANAAAAQTGALPPELARPPKAWTPPTDLQKQLADALGIEGKGSPPPAEITKRLTAFIQKNPTYPDGYYFRGTENFCFVKDQNYASMASDFDAAIAKFSSALMLMEPNSLAGLHAMRARVELLTGKYREAMTDLDSAVDVDPSEAQSIFGSGGVEPDAKGDGCAWGLDDFAQLEKRYPTDFRISIYRGLYFSFFGTFKETYRDKALQEFQKADSRNPRSALSAFLIGELYTRASMFGLASAKSDAVKNETIRKAAQQYSVSIQRDPEFLPAYKARSESYFELKEDALAIKDYDTVVARDPNDGAAYNDRGLAEMDLGRYVAATVDFGDALSKAAADSDFVSQTYENRADAYTKEGEYTRAIADLDEAIARSFGQQAFLMGINRVRKLYPELDRISDEGVSSMLRKMYWPQFTDEVFSSELLDKGKTWEPSFILADLYVKRGDLYFQTRDFRRAAADFSRVFAGFGDYGSSIDRWRPLGSRADEAIFVDAKTIVFLPAAPVLWLKTVGKRSTYTVDAYEFDCSTGSINNTSTISYDANGNVLRSFDPPGGWQRTVPDSLGEQLLEGMCAERAGK